MSINPMQELPLGLGMAFAKNPEAMNRFSAMTKQQQQQIIEHTKVINSKLEMQQYVNSLAAQPPAGQ